MQARRGKPHSESGRETAAVENGKWNAFGI